MAQDTNNYIVSALKAGFGIRQIAQGLGVTDGAVTQTIEAHGLRDLATENSRFQNIDNMYNKLEEKALQKLENSLKYAALNPMQACGVIRTLNGAKRRSLAEGQTILNQNNTQLVSLQLPKRHLPKVVKNDQNEIIEVDGRELTTMPSGELPTSRQKQEPEVLEDESNSEEKTLADLL